MELVIPVITALVLPPVPWLILILIGAIQIPVRRALGLALIILSCALVWLSASQGVSQWLLDIALQPPPALSASNIETLKRQAAASAPDVTAIVVLGGGREPRAPEYDTSDLRPMALERLRYGLWLSRATGLPVGFSGGVGWVQTGVPGEPEAEIAARIAKAEFGQALRWLESGSHDTRENADRMLLLLRQAGVKHIVLVTHAWHMPRAQLWFQHSAGPAGIRVTPAPMGFFSHRDHVVMEWLPTGDGYVQVRLALREWLALQWARIVS